LNALISALIKLKKVALAHVSFYSNDRLNDPGSHRPANCIKSFSVLNFRSDTLRDAIIDQRVVNTVNNCILYIGPTLKSLQEFALNVDGAIRRVVNENPVMDSLAVALAILQGLKSYSSDLCPPSEPLIDAMDKSRLQLNRFLARLDDSNPNNVSIIQSLPSATSISAITSLEVCARKLIENILFFRCWVLRQL
jgi:hypothetical protein